MSAPDIFPRLKPQIEALQIEHEGRPMILLRDHEGFSAAPVAISPGAFLVAMLFDGKTPVDKICGTFMQKTGQVLSSGDVKNLGDQLGKAYLLENERLVAKRSETEKAFKESAVRPAVMAGVGYPPAPMDLGVQLGRYYNDPAGPQKPNASTPIEPHPALGLVVPHIDFNRGGPHYATAYQRLSEFPVPDVIVAFGVAHQSPNSPWVMTRKAYETPYGPVAVDAELADRFRSHLWYPADADEGIHRLEHSLEFQAVWLRYLWREKCPKWVPILCASFDRFAPDFSPSKVDTIRTALTGFADEIKTLRAAGKNVLILAGVDLAHVGKRFGDAFELDSNRRKKVEEEDRASLKAALNGDPDQFYLSVIKDGHWRKVCGLSALFSSLTVMRQMEPAGIRGELLSYGQADDPMGGLVSFAGAVFRDQSGRT